MSSGKKGIVFPADALFDNPGPSSLTIIIGVFVVCNLHLNMPVPE
jgi:hypothetical protein